MNDIKQAFLESEEVKRLQTLEKVLDNNQQLQSLISKLKDKQKQMVNAKEFNQPKQYNIYKDEYEDLYSQIMNFPFVEEYIELLQKVNDDLSLACQKIEDIINKKINAKFKQKVGD